MLKGYVTGWETIAETTEEKHRTDFRFDSHPENACDWETRESAEVDRAFFELRHIIIESSEGGTHTCTGFTIEELAPDKFVIFCMAPFIHKVLNNAS